MSAIHCQPYTLYVCPLTESTFYSTNDFTLMLCEWKYHIDAMRSPMLNCSYLSKLKMQIFAYANIGYCLQNIDLCIWLCVLYSEGFADLQIPKFHCCLFKKKHSPVIFSLAELLVFPSLKMYYPFYTLGSTTGKCGELTRHRYRCPNYLNSSGMGLRLCILQSTQQVKWLKYNSKHDTWCLSSL